LKLNVIFIADIMGEPGRKAVKALLPEAKRRFSADAVIANGENAAGGLGITRGIAEDLLASGIDLLTSGNHIWDKKEIITEIAKIPRLIRPANYPEEAPGKGSATFQTAGGVVVAVINLSGRVFMEGVDSPFKVADRELAGLDAHKVVIVDFHAEATSEKAAMGWHLDGRVSAVLGTHTHVQTADDKILPNGTAFITDAGMTGAFDSIIGMKKEESLRRFITQVKQSFEVAEKDIRLQGVRLEIDSESGRALGIERFTIKMPGS
jgi:metallophosphoesterase (TIGR00282 family)